MIPVLLSGRSVRLALLLLLGLAASAGGAQAAVISFRNDTESAILVQGVSVVNRVARRGKLHLLRPGEISREVVLLPGAKLIVVADFKQPARTLCQEWIQVGSADLYFIIRTEPPEKPKEEDDAAKAKGQKRPAAQVKLVPSKPFPPTPPPTPRH